MTATNTPSPAMQEAVLTDLELLDVGAKHGRPSVALLPMWRAVEAAVLSKLRAPVADERISLRGAANLAFNALHECKPAKGAEKQYSDAIQALQSALHDIAYTVNRTATPQQFADHLQREARAALASAPVAGETQPVAVLRFERGTPGKENEMPRVVSCNRMPDGDYSVYAAPQAGEAVRDALIAASNYIDTLGGDSKSYRAALSAQPGAQKEQSDGNQ